MIRRWLYLNEVNNVYKVYQPLDIVVHMKSLKVTTYWRKDLYHTPTKLRRKQTSRRKHLHNWLIYNNILTDWSKEYLFFKKHIRWLLTLQCFKNSFLIYNLLLFKNSIPRDFIGYEASLILNIVKKVNQYNPNRFLINTPFFKNFNCTYLCYITTNLNFDEIQKTSELTLLTPFLPYQTSLYIDEYTSNNLEWLNLVILSLYKLSFNKLIELYKIAILLTLSTTL